ncbi:hypothetical protein D3C72_685860 [compost metagenome]
MDQALVVDVPERAAHLLEGVLDPVGGQGQLGVEAIALDDLHGEVGAPGLVGAEVEDLDQQGVLQAGHPPEFLLEGRRARVGGEDLLQGDLAALERVESQAHAAHAAFAQKPSNFVARGG